MTRKYFDEFITIDTELDLEELKKTIRTIKYDGFSSVRKDKNGRFICGLSVGSNKKLATSSATREMAERAYMVIERGVK